MKSNRVRFASAAKFVVSLGCLFAAITGAAAPPTDRCPNPNRYTQQSDPDHYFSDVNRNHGDKAPNQCNSCEDPANNGQKACDVYRDLHSDTCKGESFCSNGKAHFNVYRDKRLRYALAHISSRTKPCHFVVFALDPVIGVEDAKHRADRNFWNHAEYASRKLIDPRIEQEELGLAINPATRRGQHQLHIHIGKLKESYRQAIATLSRDEKFQPVEIGGVKFRVVYVPNQKGPFAGLSPFELVSKEFGERFMPREGIIVARSGKEGWFVFAALDKFVEGELDYTSQQCSMPPPP